MDRITEKNIEGMVERTNSMLTHEGSKFEVVEQGAYGKKNLYLRERGDKRGGLHDTLRTGLTKAEAYEFLLAMQRGLELSSEAKLKKVI